MPGKEKFFIAFDAFSVPENSIFVQGGTTISQRDETERVYKKYPVSPAHGLLPDLSISARFTGSTRNSSKVLQVEGETNITVDLVQGVLPGYPGEGIELYLYVDGTMIHEGPAQQLPAKILMDSRKFSNGLHVVTINFQKVRLRIHQRYHISPEYSVMVLPSCNSRIKPPQGSRPLTTAW